MNNYSWEEVKDATNVLESQMRSLLEVPPLPEGTEFVRDICQNGLPHAMVQVMAMCYANEIPFDDPNAKIIINGYRQLKDNGCVGRTE